MVDPTWASNERPQTIAESNKSSLETNTISETHPIDDNRRAVLVGAGVAAALGAAEPLFAATNKHAGHRPKAQSLINAAEDCEDTGEACLAHCFETFKAGDTTLAECAVVTDNAIVACSAIAKLAVNKSPHLKAMTGVCKSVCEDCETECLKHVEKHAICKDMADACKEIIMECKKIVG